VGGHELTVTPSLGISLYPSRRQGFRNAAAQRRRRDVQGQGAGRNAFQFYSSEMNVATLERLLMESGLRRALGAAANSSSITSRWSSRERLDHRRRGADPLAAPELGLIMPDQFIHVAEDTGLINPIGEWVLREACRQAQAWQDAGCRRW
jgi:predicted signal transduction protein with EAL and GGDEF domain